MQIVDAPPIPSYGATYQAGLYYLGGAAKPAAQAFRLPFVTRRLNTAQIDAWGRAPAAGNVEIERLRGRRWVLLRRLRVRVGEVFTATLEVRGRAILRAQVDAQTSLAWTQRS